MEAPEAEPTRARLNRLAWLLDNSIRIPGTDFRIGLDAILGLVPGAGDAAGMVLSGYIVLAAARLGAPASVLFRMMLNIAVEGLVGAIPVAGDIFDAAWKANQRNAALLNAHLDRPGAAVASRRSLVLFVVAALTALIVVISALLFLIAYGLWSAISAPGRP
ncbi:MAG TPA: DUF4112 domain-containing protein [Burkholderiales bacterium]|nr:DUF4112 domain-containing protein [Burkholderiales bacterium]